MASVVLRLIGLSSRRLCLLPDGIQMSLASRTGRFLSTDSSSTNANESSKVEEAETMNTPPPPSEKILVLGGNGFVGSHVCKEALANGLTVCSFSRSGRSSLKESWANNIIWHEGDLLLPESWKDVLNGVTSVISCVGGFGSNSHMYKINGTANINAVNAASEKGIKRFVYISAADFGFVNYLLKGYYEGKRATEKELFSKFPYGGVALRPGFIHGTRQVGNMNIPLGLIGSPLEMVLLHRIVAIEIEEKQQGSCRRMAYVIGSKKNYLSAASAAARTKFRSTHLRTLSTETLTASPSQTSVTLSPPQPLDLTSFPKLFESTPTKNLLRALFNLHLMSIDPAVDLGIAVMRSKMMQTEDGLLKKMVLKVVKKTVYEHFCAGEDVTEAAKTMHGLWKEGLKGILDYGLEDAEGNEDCDRNLLEFLKTVEMTTRLPPSSVSFACVKITAICPISLLIRVSDLLRWEYKHPATASQNLPWKLPSFPVLSESSPLYHTQTRPPPLSASEQEDLHLAEARLFTLCQRCADANLPILVDAEYSSVQPAIDHLTCAAMVKFNERTLRHRGSEDAKLIVYGTVQAYLKDSIERLALASDAARKHGVPIGFKLVRGAYITREAALANSFGEKSPIHNSIGETHACYNRCAEFMLDKIADGTGAVVLATHNLESGKLVATKAEELGIRKQDENLQFAQLMGMAAGLSLGLRNAGFNVSKYLPFGPVDQVLPYLLRRAEENRGLLSGNNLDIQLMRNELKARMKRTVLGT